ncbi:hypothetical protein Spb1_09870 [Planctopirus ephydatiae]|uniref:Uncharacterized protein n=1 Tax=Planctopirus ephydatiae TaxID=2528019 RepID=A0A518GKM5_9PLAN|nr:hypothetical protein [Planctopirus ephydatiae]QDV29118.1 hypothetical protein Spb1_09870 [Planctopirus ephydatiae]
MSLTIWFLIIIILAVVVFGALTVGVILALLFFGIGQAVSPSREKNPGSSQPRKTTPQALPADRAQDFGRDVSASRKPQKSQAGVIALVSAVLIGAGLLSLVGFGTVATSVRISHRQTAENVSGMPVLEPLSGQFSEHVVIQPEHGPWAGPQPVESILTKQLRNVPTWKASLPATSPSLVPQTTKASNSAKAIDAPQPQSTSGLEAHPADATHPENVPAVIVASLPEQAPLASTDFERLSPLPDWAVEISKVPPHHIHLVSGRFPTLAEAEADASQKLSAWSISEIQRRHPDLPPLNRTSIDPSAEVMAAVMQKAVEETEHQFGNATARMYAVHLLVSSSQFVPTVTLHRLHQLHEEQVSSQRLTILGVAGAGLALLAWGMMQYSRRKHSMA